VSVRNRPYRVANIVAIAVALSISVFCVWYEGRHGKTAWTANGGLLGLIFYLIFQVLYDNQAEIAFSNVHARVDLQAGRIDRLERRLRSVGVPDAE
jgi:hypothetical protein